MNIIYLAGNSNGVEGAVKAMNEFGNSFAAAVLFDGMYTVGKKPLRYLYMR